jgi:hypothetical protein
MPCRGLYELGSYSYLGLERQDMGMTPDSLFESGNGMRAAWGMLVGEWAVMLVLAWYLEQVCGALLSAAQGCTRNATCESVELWASGQ